VCVQVPLAAAVVTQTTAREAKESANTSTVRLTSVAEEPHRLGLRDEINIIPGDGINHPSPIMGTVTEVSGLYAVVLSELALQTPTRCFNEQVIDTHHCGVRIPTNSATRVVDAVAAGTVSVQKVAERCCSVLNAN
jgi:hypothetical protein